MILKLMDASGLQDSDPRKHCRIIDDVQELNFKHLATGETALDVQYRHPNRDLMSETFILASNAYLMNDSGKTIQMFYPCPAYEGEVVRDTTGNEGEVATAKGSTSSRWLLSRRQRALEA